MPSIVTVMLASAFMTLAPFTAALAPECDAVQSVVSKIASCNTASAFCAALGATPAKTTTITTTITDNIWTSTTLSTTAHVTVTSPARTVTVAATSNLTTTVIAPGTTTTITIVNPKGHCTISALPTSTVQARHVEPRAGSCDLDGHSQDDLSAGCNCVFASASATTTVTRTVYKDHTITYTFIPTSSSVVSGTVVCTTYTPGHTTTVTPSCTKYVQVATQTACPTPATTCGNAGLEWASYQGEHHDGQPDDNWLYSNAFDPKFLKTHTPNMTGSTGEIGGFSVDFADLGDTWQVYGTTLSSYWILLDHRGYFFAPQSGVYKFVVPPVDNKAFLWIGSLAYSGWTARNAELKVNLYSGNFSARLCGGNYYAFRFFFGQGGGPGYLDFEIQGPGGEVLAASGLSPSPYFVKYACDNADAPAYLPFGSEI